MALPSPSIAVLFSWAKRDGSRRWRSRLRGGKVRSLTRRPVLAAPAMSHPALHNGLLYLRNEQEMVCIDLRKEDAAPDG